MYLSESFFSSSRVSLSVGNDVNLAILGWMSITTR